MRYLHVAVKNVVREKKRSLLLAGAIAFGLMVIILVGSLADGIMDSFVNQQAGMISGHVVIKGFRYSSRDSLVSSMKENDPILENTREFFDTGDRINKRSTAMGTFINGSEAMQQFVMGIDPDLEEDLKNLLILEEGNYLSDITKTGILLSKVIAEDLGLKIGDSVLLKTRTIEGVNNVGNFIVEGIISDDLGIISSMAAFVHHSYLNEVLGIESGDFTELHLFLDQNNSTEVITNEFYEFLKNKKVPLVDRPLNRQERQEILARLSTKNWEGIRYQLSSLEETFSSVYVIGIFLNGTSVLIMMILMGIIVVGISNTLRMMIFERRKEIGTMRALGMQRKAVVKSFILEMQIIAFFGVVAGSVLALLTGLLIHSITFDLGHTFFSMFLYQGHLTMSFVPLRFVLTGVIILFLVLIASLIPAGKAAKVDPAKAIHSIY
ncbi:MAG: FtsX-like permease family protein [Spirochaetaceae bacterium]|jgi:putative ABC transport system permease protein|nr:FtsX-like permease family protein [Spirochaetaceae bacterium]